MDSFNLTSSQKESLRTIKFSDICLVVVCNFYNSKSRVGDVFLSINRQCLDNSFYSFLYSKPIFYHSKCNSRSKSSQNIRLNTAAESIRQNSNTHIVINIKFYIIATKFFAIFNKTSRCKINKISHYSFPSSSSKMKFLSFVKVIFVSAVVSPSKLAISWATVICFAITCCAISTVSIFKV